MNTRNGSRGLRLGVLLPVAASLLAGGCHHPHRQRLIGTWQVEFELSGEEARQLVPMENPLIAAVGQALLSSLRADLRLTFQAGDRVDLEINLLGNTVRRSGRWRFIRAEGESVTIAVDWGGESGEREWTLQFRGDDAFATAPRLGSGWQLNRAVTFQRLQPAAPSG